MPSYGSTMSSPVLPPNLEIPPFILNSYEFIQHFALFFLIPIGTIVISAFILGAIVRYIYLKLFARYATPQELLDDALNQMKKGRRSRALDTLRLIIKLQPDKCFSSNGDMMKPYIALATELFHMGINNNNDAGDCKQRKRRSKENNNIGRRRSRLKTTQQHDKESNDNLSPTLIECQDIILQGLCLDPQNESLLKLQTEVQLIKQYGRNDAHLKMLRAGWVGN